MVYVGDYRKVSDMFRHRFIMQGCTTDPAHMESKARPWSRLMDLPPSARARSERVSPATHELHEHLLYPRWGRHVCGKETPSRAPVTPAAVLRATALSRHAGLHCPFGLSTVLTHDRLCTCACFAKHSDTCGILPTDLTTNGGATRRNDACRTVSQWSGKDES